MRRLIIAMFLTLSPMCAAWLNEAHATTIMALSDEELIDKAEVIVHGTIVRVESFQYDTHTILTKVTLRVEEFFKTPDGISEGTEFDFYTRGGTLGDMVQTVSGEFRAVEGAEVIVFLEKIRKYNGLWMVLGLKTGAYWIENSNDSAPEKMTRERFSLACGKVKPESVPLKSIRERIIRRVSEHHRVEAE